MKVFLIRHAPVSDKQFGQIQYDHLDQGLSASGRVAAEELGNRLSKEPLPATIFTSEMRRSVETAAILRPSLEPFPAVADFNELYKGFDLHLQQFPEHAELTTLDWERQYNNSPDKGQRLAYKYPSGVSINDMSARVWKAFQNTLSDYQGHDFAIVTHNGPIKAIISVALGYPELYTALRISYASYAVLTYDSGGFTLEKLNG